MKIVLDLTKSIEENANEYFEKAKKARKKEKGALKAIEETKKRREKAPVEKEIKSSKKIIKRDWYEKFKWFYSSDDLLVIGGRDAATNEMIIKKYAEPGDVVFHTDMSGSPFVLIKTNGKKPSENSMREAAEFTASQSRAWRNGMASLEVFFVNPEQVTKEARAGESLSRGAFVIKGKTNYIMADIGLGVCEYNKKIMVAPKSACEKHAKKVVHIIPGSEKSSEAAKKIKNILKSDAEVDDIIRQLPAGGLTIKK